MKTWFYLLFGVTGFLSGVFTLRFVELLLFGGRFEPVGLGMGVLFLVVAARCLKRARHPRAAAIEDAAAQR